MSTLVSVLLPYRNAAKTIESAIGSVLQQSYRWLELIAVDDGSSDEGPSIVAALAKNDQRLQPLRTQGVGIVGALSRALDAAKGRFIARMDGDDICLPSRLDKQVALLKKHQTLGVVGVQVQGFPSNVVGDGMKRYIQWQNGILTPEQHRREIFVEAPLCHPSVLLRREALEQEGAWIDVEGPEDYDLWLRLDAAGWAMAKVPEVLLRWRHLPDRATFRDGRYTIERFREGKASYLAERVKHFAKMVVIWGAGPTGKRTARALEKHGVFPSFFVDIDPKKIGRIARGVPILAPDDLPDAASVVVAVGARGAREPIRSYLRERGLVEGANFLFAS